MSEEMTYLVFHILHPVFLKKNQQIESQKTKNAGVLLSYQ